MGERLTAQEMALWEQYFSAYPPGFLTAEMVGRFMAGFASTKAKPVSLSEVAPWVKRRAGKAVRKRTRRSGEQLAAAFRAAKAKARRGG